MTNAIIENKNAIIKCVKKNANGYTNWERFRNRIMYVLDPKATYSLYPIQNENKVAKPCSLSFKAMWGVNHPTLLETQNFMTPCYFGAPKNIHRHGRWSDGVQDRLLLKKEASAPFSLCLIAPAMTRILSQRRRCR